MTVNGANNETNRRLQRLEEGQAETNRRLDNLETGQEKLRSGQEELRSGQEELREAVTRIERNVQAIRDDIGPLKAAHAANGARKAVYRICLALSLQPVGILSEATSPRSFTRQIPPGSPLTNWIVFWVPTR